MLISLCYWAGLCFLVFFVNFLSILYLAFNFGSIADDDWCTVAIVRLQVQIMPVVAVYQCQLGVPSLCGRLMTKLTSESWGVTVHTMQFTGPVSSGIATSAGVQLRAIEMEISTTLWALRLMKDFTFTFYFAFNIFVD